MVMKLTVLSFSYDSVPPTEQICMFMLLTIGTSGGISSDKRVHGLGPTQIHESIRLLIGGHLIKLLADGMKIHYI